MKQVYLIKKNNPSLLLFFAGWGMDENPFKTYCPEDCDFMVCYDYRSLAFDHSMLEKYASVRVVAWSMGVWAASQVLAGLMGTVNLNESIALNGTNFPVDDRRGISLNVFQGTLSALNEANLQKFFRRMCGNKESLESFLRKAPRRPVEELKEELKCIGELCGQLPVSSFRWNRAIAGKRDKIFLPDNQQQAWAGVVNLEMRDMEHYPEEYFEELFGSTGSGIITIEQKLNE